MPIPDEAIQSLRDLYQQGLYLQAYQQSARYGALKEWSGGPARMIASRLAGHLGAPRLSLWHRLKAWREAPEDPEVRYYYAWAILERSSPYDAWRFLQEQGDMPAAPVAIRASWYALHAQLAGVLRDFDTSEHWLERAIELQSDLPWVHVTRSMVLESEDRYEEALAAADRALEIQPWFRPAVQARAHVLTLLERDDDAFEFLQQAAQKIECASLYWQVAGIHFEREQYPQVAAALEQFEAMSPLLEPHFAREFFSLKSFLAYRMGDDAAAVEWARKSGGEYDLKIAERLEDPARRPLRRVLLPVGFTRQHHMTCVPATLSTISRYWGMPAEHLQLADHICYNGTSNFAERRWATENGWAVREFTVTEASTHTLIDAGIPFTLTTVDPGSAHLQAVIGYDARRGSIIIRDPYLRQRREAFATEFLEIYGPFGPRGMALAPPSHADRLAGLELPDADLWDEVHRIDFALTEHRRDDAAKIVEALRARHSDHFLTLQAAMRLAIYDANPSEELAATERLLAKFPQNEVMQLTRLSHLRHLSRRDERLETLKALTDKADVNPAFLLQYAQELAQDAGEQETVVNLLRRSIRLRPTNPGAYFVLGNVLWDRLEFDEALELYRFAACLDDKDEQLAEAYFGAAQHCRQTAVVLDWLRRRSERFGTKSSHPARTLEWALSRLERSHEALDILEDALRKRPDDGELQLYAAGVFAAAHSEHLHRAQEMLAAARDNCPRPQWLRGAARIASLRGEFKEALQLYYQVLELQPLAMDAHRAVASLLSETDSREATLNYLRATVDRFPHHQPLLELWVEWLRDEPPEDVEPVIRTLLEYNSANAWAVRELGFLLIKQRRLEEAAATAVEAERLDPTSIAVHHLKGELCYIQGNLPEARTAYRKAILLSVDNEYAIGELLSCCQTLEERRAELEFVRGELVRQVIYGGGLLAYRSYAHYVLEPEELLANLREALAERPDLWHAWSACVRQLVAMERLDEAADLVQQATMRFPLLPRLWLDRAEVCQARGDEDGQIEALEAARRINPSWSEVLRPLSDIYLRRGDWERARSLLESAVRAEPLDGLNHGWLAEVLWKQGEQEAALEAIEWAVTLAPGYEWAWGKLCSWSEEAEQPDRPKQAARRLVEKKPGEARSWLVLAKVLEGGEHLEESLAALDRATELNPRSIDAHSQRARLLADAERYEEALEACRPDVWGARIPAELRSRAAWVQWVSGDAIAAVAEMRAALADDPSLYGAWQTLADWLNELGDQEGYLEAARAMLRLDPYGATTLGYYGEALVRNDDTNTAKEMFRRAFETQPDYVFAGMWLFDLQFDSGDLAAAEQTLAALQSVDHGPFVRARAVQVAANQQDRTTAISAFRDVCLDPESAEWPVRTSFDALRDAGWVDDAERIVTEALDQSGVIPEVGALWVQIHIERGDWSCSDRFESLMHNKPLGAQAVYAWVEGLLRANQSQRLRAFVDRNSEWLRENTYTWGTIAYGWAAFRNWPAGAAWTANWRDYPDAQPWMLVNVAEAFRNTARDDEAAEVSRVAVAQPREFGTQLHRLWLAADAVVAGQWQQAAEQIEWISCDELDPDYQLLYTLIDSCLKMSTADEAARPAMFAQVRRGVTSAIAKYPKLDAEPARRRFYLHCLNDIAQKAGTRWAKLWSWWRRLTAA